MEPDSAPVSSGAGKGRGKAIAKGRSSGATPAVARSLSEHSASDYPRFTTHIGELDQVLGGGLVPGSAIVFSAHPGSGKSTLCSSIIDNLAANGKKVLWVAGEESPSQVRLRTDRMGLKHSQDVHVITDQEVGVICATIEAGGYDFVVVDSINTVHDEEREAAPSTTSVIKEAAQALTRTAKNCGAVVLLIAHVTKDGNLSGPKHMEHIVDVVLEMTGDRTQAVRMVRTVKNRFGSTNEVGVFEMRGSGLHEVTDPNAVFLADRSGDEPGSVVCPVVEGTRPLLIEVQALVSPTAAQGGFALRRAQGIDKNRLDMLLAILSQRSGMNLKLGTKDVYVQVSGGLAVREPALDLAVCMAVASAASDRPVAGNVACFGEVSLLGEVRAVSDADRRLAEARKLGFTTVLAGPRQGTHQFRSLKQALRKGLALDSGMPKAREEAVPEEEPVRASARA